MLEDETDLGSYLPSVSKDRGAPQAERDPSCRTGLDRGIAVNRPRAAPT